MEKEQRMEEPECYLNTQTGDLYITWWKPNRPSGKDWVKISRYVYNFFSRNTDMGEKD